MNKDKNYLHIIKYNLYETFRKISLFFCKGKRNTNRKYINSKYSTWLFAYGILLLPIIYFLIFYLYVNFDSIMLSFKDISDGSFTLNNFKYIFTEIVRHDSGIFTAIKNTMVFWLLGWILIPIQILVSFILYKKIFGYKFYQTLFYLPTIIGGVVWMTAYKNFILPEGPFCHVMKMLGIFKEGYVPELLTNSDYALTSVVMASFWLGIPANMLIYCGSLSRIPFSVIEASKLDGVGFWGEIWYITIPFLGPLIGTQILLHCTSILNASGNILLLTEGRAGTTTLNYWLYDRIVVNNQYNVPAAMGLLMMLFTLPIVILSRILTRKIEDMEY